MDPFQHLSFCLLGKSHSGTHLCVVVTAPHPAPAGASQTTRAAYTGQAVDKQPLEGMFARKTGKMIAASIMMVADCGTQLSTEQFSQLERYANLAGLCFQIHDDILDVTQTEEILGKPAGSDIRNDRSTYPALFGLQAAVDRAAQLLQLANDCLDQIGPDADGLRWLTEYIVSCDH